MFTYNQKSVLSMLAAGKTITDTAAQLKINQATISKWKSDPAFNTELDRMTKAFMQSTIAAARASLESQIERAAACVVDAISGDPERMPASRQLTTSIKLLQAHGLMTYQPPAQEVNSLGSKKPNAGLIPVQFKETNIVPLTGT
ncbi:MAG TPA: phBC6A51 family helix-turn-helix protein [Planctomycetota bacterium]|jgi:hypothetical protein